jgi:hypothetical protein
MRISARCIAGIFLAAVLLLRGSDGADFGRVFKSACFPGMGQLGDDQVIKGLTLMGVEVVALTMATQEWSRYTAYTRETEYLSVKYDLDSTYALKKKTHEKWGEAYDKSGKANMYMYGYFAAAGVCYLLNLADAVLFPPAARDEAPVKQIQQVPVRTEPEREPAMEEEAPEVLPPEEPAEEEEVPEGEETAPPPQEQPKENGPEKAPETAPEGESLLHRIHDNTRIAVSPIRSSICYVVKF